MPEDVLTKIILPLGLALIMFTLGCGLRLQDFKRVFLFPKAISVGLFCQFVVLPLVAFALITAFNMSGAMAVGFMLIAACPTGPTSNLLAYHARADVALSLTFTAVSSIASILTVPLILGWALVYFEGANQSIDFPVGLVMAQIGVTLGVPVVLGMLCRARAPTWTQRWQSAMSALATGIFVVVLIVAISKNREVFAEHGATLTPVVLSLNVLMLLIGFFASKWCRLSLPQAATVAIESAIQNGTLAIVIASSLLLNDAMAVPAIIYATLMYLTGIVFTCILRRYTRPAIV